MGIGKAIKGEDNETGKEWTTQVLYDTTNACYAGTLRWIIMANPSLIGQPPPPLVQRQMIQHCFCVMDKIRNEFDMEQYVNLIKSGLVFMITRKKTNFPSSNKRPNDIYFFVRSFFVQDIS